MNKNRELINNTIIIFVGRFCTQFVSFLLVPIYTHYLLTSDYGYVDLIQTYVVLLAPMIILRFDSAIFRFLIDYRKKEDGKNEIITSSAFLLFFQILISILLFCIINAFVKFQYGLGILLNIVFVSVSSYLLQLTRGIGKNIDYSIASIISGVITITVNVVLIVCFKYNASTILYASALANIFCSSYLILKNHLYRYIKPKSFNKSKLKDMLKYSLPMIPDGLSWWIVNVSDRTMLSYYIGTGANGIYAISSKLSNILSSLLQIFNMSWQESASLHIDDEDKNSFFTDVLNNTYSIFYSICILILVAMPFVFYIFIGKDYMSAYYYIPILLMGNLFNALANITGGVYIAKKQTKKVARTTMMAAAINIIINFIFIRRFGLYAAAASTLISYIVVAIYRYIDVQKYVKMRINYKMFLLTIILFILSSGMYYINNLILNIINLLFVSIIVVFNNKNNLKIIYKKIKQKIKK